MPLCGSFRRAAPLVEYLINGKKIYYKLNKRKRSNYIFTHGLFLLYRGLDSSILNVRKNKNILEFENSICVLLNKNRILISSTFVEHTTNILS